MAIRPIYIEPLLNGYLVRVGCSSVAFTDKEKLCRELRDYLDRPVEVEQRYMEQALNKPGPMAEPATPGRLVAAQDCATQTEAETPIRRRAVTATEERNR